MIVPGEPTREVLLHCYRKLKQKGKLSEKIPTIGIIFGDFLAKSGHRRFLIHECESFINIKRNVGRVIITFSVFDESSGKNDELIVGWRLLKNGHEKYTVWKMRDLEDTSHGARNYENESERNIWNHYEGILREFIEFLKKRNFTYLESKLH